MENFKKRLLLIPLYVLCNSILHIFVLPINKIINWKTCNRFDNPVNQFRRYYIIYQ